MAASANGAGLPNVSFERERGVYSIHVTRDVAHAVINIADGKEEVRSIRILSVFRALAGSGVAVFLIKLHRSAVTFALAGVDLERAEAALRAAGLNATVRRDLAVVTTLAASMREIHNVIVDITDALLDASARLIEIGDSHNSVQCLIEVHRVEPAVEALCHTFHLEPRAVTQSSAEPESEP